MFFQILVNFNQNLFSKISQFREDAFLLFRHNGEEMDGDQPAFQIN